MAAGCRLEGAVEDGVAFNHQPFNDQVVLLLRRRPSLRRTQSRRGRPGRERRRSRSREHRRRSHRPCRPVRLVLRRVGQLVDGEAPEDAAEQTETGKPGGQFGEVPDRPAGGDTPVPLTALAHGVELRPPRSPPPSRSRSAWNSLRLGQHSIQPGLRPSRLFTTLPRAFRGSESTTSMRRGSL